MKRVWKTMQSIKTTCVIQLQPIPALYRRFSTTAQTWCRSNHASKTDSWCETMDTDIYIFPRRRSPSKYLAMSRTRQNTIISKALQTSCCIDDYELLDILGRGTFGVVKLAKHKATGQSVAIKILNKEIIQDMQQETNILREQTAHLSIAHPFVTRMFATFQDDDAIYFVIEFCPGGELYSLIYAEEMNTHHTNHDSNKTKDPENSQDGTESESDSESPRQKYKIETDPITLSNNLAKLLLKSQNEASSDGLVEKHIAFYLACVAMSLQHLHERDILYRDLKLENLVLDVDGYPKLIDFGLSKLDAAKLSHKHTMCGSMEYMAPEIVQKKPYDFRADIWSFGIIMYELYFGKTPFYDENTRLQYKKIIEEDVTFPDTFEETNSNGYALIKSLLAKDPEERPQSFEEIMQSSFFQHYFPTEGAWKDLETKLFIAPFVPQLDGPFDIRLFRATSEPDDDFEEYYV